MLFVIKGREANYQIRIPILPDRKKKCRSTKKQTDGPKKNHEDRTSLAGLYFVPADDGDGGDKKQT